jgi:hypothetical protein
MDADEFEIDGMAGRGVSGVSGASMSDDATSGRGASEVSMSDGATSGRGVSEASTVSSSYSVEFDEYVPLCPDVGRRNRLLSHIPGKPKQSAWIDTLIRLEKLENVSVEITESNPFDVLFVIVNVDGELRGSFKW